MIWGKSPPRQQVQQQMPHSGSASGPQVATPPPKPGHRFELTSGSECLMKGAGPTKVADRYVKMLAAEADRLLKWQQDRLDATPPPPPGAPFPDPEEYAVHAAALLPGLRVWELVFDDASEVVKTAVLPRDDVLELADADFAPTARALKRWNDDAIMEQLEGLVMGAAQRSREAGGAHARTPGNREDLNVQLDAAFETYNRKDRAKRSTNMSAFKPLDLGIRF